MPLLERRASYRFVRTGLHDTVARFIHDLATAGVPMSLASVKAASDAAGHKRRAARPAGTYGNADSECLALILPIRPLAGLP